MGENPDPAGTPSFDHLDRLISFERLSEIARFDLLDPGLAARLDEVAHRTMTRLGQPCSYVSIVLDSAQLIIGSSGMEGWIKNVGGTPVEWAFCGHTVARAEPYLVENAFADPNHADSPLVAIEGTGSYAGVPLVTDSGQVLGAHCVISSEPQQFGADQVAVLQAAAAEIMGLLQEYRIDPGPLGGAGPDGGDDAPWEPAGTG